MLRATTPPVTVLVALGVAAGACGDVPAATGGSARSAVPDTASRVLESAVPLAPAPRASVAETCIKGGTPREEVRRIMGEPDSVSFGSWLYGPSEIMFGYGVVVETRNSGGNLVLC